MSKINIVYQMTMYPASDVLRTHLVAATDSHGDVWHFRITPSRPAAYVDVIANPGEALSFDLPRAADYGITLNDRSLRAADVSLPILRRLAREWITGHNAELYEADHADD